MRREIKELLLYSILFMALVSIPLNNSSSNPLVNYGISLIIDLILLLLIGNSLIKAGAFNKYNQELNVKNFLIMLPIWLVVLVPLIVAIIFHALPKLYVGEYFYFDLLNDVTSVLIEEMLFRIAIYKRLPCKTRLERILKSAGVYAAFEIFTFFSTFSILSTLFAMLSQFILGLILGFIVEYAHSVYPCFIYNYLFRITSVTNLFIAISLNSITYIYVFYGLIAFSIVFLIALYFIKFKKEEYVDSYYGSF